MSSSKNGAFVMVDFCVITDKNLDVFDKMTYVALCKFADEESASPAKTSPPGGMRPLPPSQIAGQPKGLNYLRVDSRVLGGKQRSNLYTSAARKPHRVSKRRGVSKTHPGRRTAT